MGMKRALKTLLAAALMGAACVSMGGCFWDGWFQDEGAEEEVPVVSIALTLNARDAGDEATPALVKVANVSDMRSAAASSKSEELHGLLDQGDEETASDDAPDEPMIPFADENLAEFEAKPNEAVELAVGEAGEYLIYVVEPPVSLDGSSYSAPREALNVKVEEGMLRTEARMTLERIDASDMTKQQLEASAAALIAHGKNSEAKEVLRAAESAPDEPDGPSAESSSDKPSDGAAEARPVATGNQSVTLLPNHASQSGEQDGGQGRGSNEAPSSNGSAIAGQPSASQGHQHGYRYVVDSPAKSEPVYAVSATCDQCHASFSSMEGFLGHLSRGSKCATPTLESKVVGTKNTPEQGHYECSCGSRR